MLLRPLMFIATVVVAGFAAMTPTQASATNWGPECTQSGGTYDCKLGTPGPTRYNIQGITCNGEFWCPSYQAAIDATIQTILSANTSTHIAVCHASFVGPSPLDPQFQDHFALGVESGFEGYVIFDVGVPPGDGTPGCFPNPPQGSEQFFRWARDVNCDSGWEIASSQGPDTHDTGYCHRPPVDCHCGEVGNPLDTSTAAKVQTEVDVRSSGAWPLRFERRYNSQGFIRPAGDPVTAPSAAEYSDFGHIWRHNFQRRVYVEADGSVPVAYVVDANGDHNTFRKIAGVWTPHSHRNEELIELVNGSNVRTGWRHTTSDQIVEQYDAAGKLASVTNTSGQTQTLTYTDGTGSGANGALTADTNAPVQAGLLLRVTDSFGRTLALRYNALSRIVAVTDPNNAVTQYGYDAAMRLKSVTYPDGQTRNYVYLSDESTATIPGIANLLSGIVDENGNRFATFGYDTSGRAITTEHANNADKYVVSYSWSGTLPATAGSQAVASITDPLSTARSRKTTLVNGVYRDGGQTQPCAPAGCSGTVSTNLTYNTNGNVDSVTDFNGNTVQYTYDTVRNLELTRTEAVGHAEQRMTSTQWHPTLRLPKQIAAPLQITTYSFNGETGVSCAPSGSSTALICAKTVQETNDATGAAGFGATLVGNPRTWSYTYNALGQVLTVDGPRNNLTDAADITTYIYDSQGNVASIQNALGQTTTFPLYDATGRPQTIIDANGLETHLTYLPRGWLQSRSVGKAGTGLHFETTNYDYDAAGQLKQVTLPDGSYLKYDYDAAHRLTRITDTPGNTLNYGLDNMGNRTQEKTCVTALDASSNCPDSLLMRIRLHTRVFDALNHLFQDIGWPNTQAQVSTEITESSYDDNGNLKTVKDPANRVTTQNYDALNRLTSVIDPFNGSSNPTAYAYNGQDQLTQVTDPKGLGTSYTYNGFGELTTQVSPDTGSTGFTYDAAGNLQTKTDARGVLATYTYDALNRVQTIVYPDETVTYTYDSCGNGKGRLCSIADKTGTTAWSYDLWGRVTGKAQTVGTVTQAVGYGYNDAGQLVTMTLPSGKTVTYAYANNRPVSVQVNSTTVLDSVEYMPFGPLAEWRWGNSTAGAHNYHVRTYDGDYRPTLLATDRLGSGGSTVNYTWNDTNTIASITDSASTANSFAYGYDALDRLTGVTGGATFGYGYDGVGNRITQSIGAATTTYAYTTTSHRLQSLSGAQTKSYSYDNVGNMTSDGTTTWTYGGNNRPTQAANASATVQFLINALGQRVKKSTSSSSTRFVYDEAGHLIGEYDEQGNPVTETVWLNDLPVAVVK